MRLRSSQFVFLLLLLCSVQPGQDYARQLMAATPAHAQNLSQDEHTRPAAAPSFPRIHTQREAAPARTSTLGRSSLQFAGAALFAAAVAHHTGLLRA